jgi:thiamine-phosphate pyrophosphorylase
MMCLVTDRRRLSGGRDAIDRLVDLVTAAARAGVDVIHVRERDLDARDLGALVSRCVKGVERTGARVVVNDRVDVALASGAHGVHLRSDSIPAGAARSLLPAGAVVGRSVHGVEETSAVSRAGGLDYLIFGTLFETGSKEPNHQLATLDELAAACRVASAGLSERPGMDRKAGRGIPVLAIGGITLENASLVRRAGASGVAGIGLFIPPAGQEADGYLEAVVSRLRRTFDSVEAVT